MLICADCKSENRDNAKFCRGCGISLVRREMRQPEPVLAAAHSVVTPERAEDTAERGAVNLTVAHMGAVSEVSRMTEHPASQDSVTDSCCAKSEMESRQASEKQAEYREDPPARSARAEQPPESHAQSARAEQPPESYAQSPRAEQPPESHAQSPRAEQPQETRSETHRRRRNRPAEEATPRSRPTCPSCGSHVRSLDKFCIWCGSKQPERMAQESKRCPDCGMVLPIAANFCFACGHDVEEYRAKKVRFPTELFEEVDPELVPKFEA